MIDASSAKLSEVCRRGSDVGVDLEKRFPCFRSKGSWGLFTGRLVQTNP